MCPFLPQPGEQTEAGLVDEDLEIAAGSVWALLEMTERLAMFMLDEGDKTYEFLLCSNFTVASAFPRTEICSRSDLVGSGAPGCPTRS